MATDVDGVYVDWGTPDQRSARPRSRRRDGRHEHSRPDRWAPRSRPRSSSPTATGQAGGHRLTRRSDRWIGGRHGRHERHEQGDPAMTTFGVHSEVGKLRQVIVHRPELSLKRLTPDNHDELLFDDVLWVERAQWEHDQFVARDARARGRGLLRPGSALTEALAASDDARKRLIELVASEYVVGVSLVDEVSAHLAGLAARRPGQAPARRDDRRRVGAGHSRASAGRRSSRRPSTTTRRSSCRRSRTACSPATRRAGSTAASR